MWPFQSRIKIQEQIDRLADAGIRINSDVTREDLLSFDTLDEIEKKPFSALVEILGAEIQREPFTPISNQLWMCDYERIEDTGAYRDVLLRLELMTGNALQCTDIADQIDHEGGEAWVEFSFRGKRIRWSMELDDDWLDPEIFLKYDNLLAETNVGIQLYSNSSDYGQAALLGAFSDENKRKFDRISKIKLGSMQ